MSQTKPRPAAVEKTVLVLQGGGALGAYQAGAYESLQAAARPIDWVAGISIGAINAAIICGNPAPLRVKALRRFWEGLTAERPGVPLVSGTLARQLFNEWAADSVAAFGVNGFFRPRLPVSSMWAGMVPGWPAPNPSVYDTTPLRSTLLDVVDFDYLNDQGPRLSVGAVDVETGNFAYFDSGQTTITPEHVMASGALPPGFPAVLIGEKQYWDGGLVSNTPLQFVLDSAGTEPLCIFQVDLFPARGALPATLAEVAQREKDIRFSSRTRLTTDRYRELAALRAAAWRLAEKLPDGLRDDPDLALLKSLGPPAPVALVQLIHRKQDAEGPSKDYEFSRLSMTEHWSAGHKDVDYILNHPEWRNRPIPAHGLQSFDLAKDRAKPLPAAQIERRKA